MAHGPQGGRLEDVTRPGVVVAGPTWWPSTPTRHASSQDPAGRSAHLRAADRGLGTIDLAKVRVREETL